MKKNLEKLCGIEKIPYLCGMNWDEELTKSIKQNRILQIITFIIGIIGAIACIILGVCTDI